MEKSCAASASVIHPRSPAGNPCNEDSSALSLVAGSLGASAGVALAELTEYEGEAAVPLDVLDQAEKQLGDRVELRLARCRFLRPPSMSCSARMPWCRYPPRPTCLPRPGAC